MHDHRPPLALDHRLGSITTFPLLQAHRQRTRRPSCFARSRRVGSPSILPRIRFRPALNRQQDPQDAFELLVPGDRGDRG
jgi:hypothetical protein